MRNQTWKQIVESGTLAVAYVGILALLFYPVLDAGGYFAA